MNATIELIKAKQNAIKADEEMKVAKLKRDFEVMTQTLEPLVKIIEEAKDLLTRDIAPHYKGSLNPEAPRTVGAHIDKDLHGHLGIFHSADGRLNHCYVSAPKLCIDGSGHIRADSAGRLFISNRDGVVSRQDAIDWLIEAIARLVK